METLFAFLIVSAITLFLVRRFGKAPSASSELVSANLALESKTVTCPRCGKPGGSGAASCSSCGAAPPGLGNGDKPRPMIDASLCIGCGSCVEVCPETGTLEVLSGKAILAHPERCTAHAKCVDICPTGAIILAIGDARRTIRVPSVDPDFETNVPGLFIVGELGGAGLIKAAMEEGRSVIERLRQRLAVPDPEMRHEGVPFDVIVVGAGPAGLSASLAAHQFGLNYLTLEQGEIASTIRNYPRHKFLMTEPVEVPLYGNLFVADGNKETLVSVWETIIADTGVRVHTGEGVTAIRRNGARFVVESSKRAYTGRHVVLAVGKRGTPRRLGVSGEELSKVAYRLIEAESYTDCDLLVVGGGDSAVEAALALGRNRNRTTLCYRGRDFRRIRERNNTALQEAEAEGRVTVQRNTHVREIRSRSVLVDCGGSPAEIPNDYVFVLVGGESPEDFLQRTGVEIVEKVLSG